jgi:hypothetical protein
MRDDKGLLLEARPDAGWSIEEHGTASAIHHCLKYLAHDARHLGLGQTASLLEMAAQLALDEAKTRRARH